MQKITPCPPSPNCVCSFYPEDTKHFVAPFSFNSPEIARKKFSTLTQILENHFEAKILKKENNYLHFMFTTKIFRFKDDVEFELAENLIHIRSASRLGRSDFGKNRNRMKKIRSLMKKLDV